MTRRRLPVVQSALPPKAEGTSPEESESDARPSWQWVFFGTIATFTLWLPLAYAAEALRHHLFVSRFGAFAAQSDVRAAFTSMNDVERFRWTAMQTLPHLLAFALGAFAGGFLVGRFGTGTGRREPALSGVLTALVAIAISWSVVAEGGLGACAAIVIPLAMAVGFAWLGGRVGRTKVGAAG